MTETASTAIDRRTLLGAAAAGTALLTPGMAEAASDPVAPLRKAIADAHDANIKRLQDWIALPSIAAEGRNVEEGCSFMMQLAKDAGFQHVERVGTDGVPGVFATMDNGAKKTLGLYFMYDVKQFDPAEWSSPPLEARIVDRPGMGKVLIGRGAANQKGPESAMLAALHAFKATGRKPPSTSSSSPRARRRSARPISPRSCAGPTSRPRSGRASASSSRRAGRTPRTAA